MDVATFYDQFCSTFGMFQGVCSWVTTAEWERERRQLRYNILDGLFILVENVIQAGSTPCT